MKKKEETFGAVVPSDDVGPKVREEVLDAGRSSVILVLALMALCFFLGYHLGCNHTERTLASPSFVVEAEPGLKASVGTGSNLPFTVKGAVSANFDIDGETHRLVCYRVVVTDFWLSEDPEKAEQIGKDEVFTKFLQPDGMAYHAIYYEALDENVGIKVKKEFMDCGVDNLFMAAGSKTPLTVEFYPSTGYFSGILDSHDKHRIPTVTFE